MTEDNREVDESLGLFEAALRAGRTAIRAPTVARISLQLDGSDQDATATALAEALAARLDLPLERSPATAAGADAAANLELFRAAAGDDGLLVIPVPFGEDIGSLRSESLSSSVDLALAEMTAPLLLVRRGVAGPAALLARPLAMLDWHDNLQGLAVGWCARLAGADGRASLRIAHDPELLDELRAVFDDHPEDLAAFESLLRRAETRLTGGLVAALQKLADERGFAVDFKNLGGADLARALAEEARADARLLVAAFRRGAPNRSQRRLRELVLRSDLPVLAIPG